MHYNPNNLNSSNSIPIPGDPQELIRIFPQLVLALQQLQIRINALENAVKSLETIPGNVNQL